MPKKILSIREALENPERRMIILYLLDKPGASLSQLAKDLNMGLGNLYSHILILTRVGLVKSSRENRKIALYVNDELLVNGNQKKKC